MDEIGGVFDAPTLFRAVDVLGVVGNGLLGGIVRAGCGSTWFGFLVLAMLSGQAAASSVT